MPELLAPPDADVPPPPPTVDAMGEALAVGTLDTPKLVKTFKAKVEKSRSHRRKFTSRWQHNVAARLGEMSAGAGEPGNYEQTGGDQQSEINPDWSLTKTKTANLYSQVPGVQLTHENEEFAAGIQPFAKALNYELGDKRSNVGVCMEEALNDVVNASGVAAVIVGFIARFEDVQVPAIDVSPYPPELIQQAIAAGQIAMKTVPRMTDYKFPATRLSPGDLLWPAEFTGSNFDDADWMGRTGRATWPDAKADFKLTDAQKHDAVGNGEVEAQDDLRSPQFRGDAAIADAEMVTFDELYYWRSRVDPDETSFAAIWRLVFVHGIDDPVVHEPWKGQQYDPERKQYVGNHKWPIRVLTLTYVSNHPVPPSDTAAGAPQVHDMRRSRRQMFTNRDRSRPVRWYDTNRIDLETQNLLNSGGWQEFIPTQGDGARSVGEIARASYPSEDLTFDQQTKQDLMESWQIGPNQSGVTAGGGLTATESDNVQTNFATRIGQERARVAAFFLGICEVLAGWMWLYSDFPNLSAEEKEAMKKAWDTTHVLHDVVMKIRPDSAIVLDVSQQIERRVKFLNFAGKSGLIDPSSVMAEIAELSGLDPKKVMKKPEPPPPEPPNMSYRFSGKDDLINPMVVALLVSQGKAPSPEDIQTAQKILAAAAMPATPPPPPGSEGLPGLGPGGPPEGDGPPELVPGGGPGPGGPMPMTNANPAWTLPDKIAKRAGDGDI
jgi:hypothetical protein